MSLAPQMTIGAEPLTTERLLEVINPATTEVIGHAPDAGQLELDHAVACARKAFPIWKATSHAQRRERLNAFAKRMVEHVDELAALFTLEHGRPLAMAKEEILGAAFWIRGIGQLEIPTEIVEETETRRVEVHHEPLGVVCALVPWNFPVLLAAWKISHALITGNTIVLKPSPFTPLTTLRLGELTHDIFPAGVLNIISGGDHLGPLMTAHKGFAKISFTGSTATGRRIMETAAKDLKRITLELGGNDAAIVLPDVDVDAIAMKLFMGAFFNSGQVCVACKRLYIHEDIYDRVRDKLHELALTMPIGDGMQPGTLFGPIQNLPQYRRVLQMRDEARAAGLVLLEGAAVPEQGYFMPLTLVDNPPDDARVVTEEAFGPLLPLLRFSDIDDVIARANNSEYGLAGAVWSNDVDQALAIAKRLETGTVWINQNLESSPAVPLGGHKQSGIGVENGVAGLMEFTQAKSIFVPKSA
ncbi:aldehyde dehydrogenase family protein [Pseudomonas sp. NFACC13-1]|uniref:aldehyde dehydrogenase family protein n=1 Tax=Pseudomonas sp. NFACC13-1 TaxID=1566245 RepID=UPI00088F04C8|nr:aldehyde dehydrogenase family protein [Pseudomonas sp. NFACC13-1]SDB35256.1 Acyl-CoA reductase [Pseudomonas sp. NFACC13-1]